MTKEEAIGFIQGRIKLIDKSYPEQRGYREALEMASKAMEQEPKTDGDCISRQAVIQHICEDKFCYKENCKGNIYKRCPDTMWVYDLPSVTPQEPKTDGDCISRQAVKEQVIKYGFHAPDMTATEFVEDLPSVNPQEKTGHWIADIDKWGDIVTTVNGYKCSECGMFNADNDKYCPNCGAKMESEVSE